jgi:hypothetical protein
MFKKELVKIIGRNLILNAALQRQQKMVKSSTQLVFSKAEGLKSKNIKGVYQYYQN